MQKQTKYGRNIDISIGNLDKKIRSLNPENTDFTQTKGLFILNPTKRYFYKVQRGERQISEAIKALEAEKNILTNDNITLEIEINKLSDIIEKLEKEYEIGNLLKSELNSKFSNDENSISELEKRLYDIKEKTIVKEQSKMALEIIRKNNKEIIRNIDRITNVTVEALNTAVMVAKSINNQKIVLNRMNMLKIKAGSIIKNTGNTLKDIDLLKTAFNNAFGTIEELEVKSKKAFPENAQQIIEIEKVEEGYGKK